MTIILSYSSLYCRICSSVKEAKFSSPSPAGKNVPQTIIGQVVLVHQRAVVGQTEPLSVGIVYDNAKAWCNLFRAHRNDIAAAMNIPPGDFRWYAAFHDEGDHPHVHMMAWSTKPGQACLSREDIRQIKSELTNNIFKQELLHLYEQKSTSRDELVREARKAMLELVQVMKDGICDHPEVERLMLELAMQLETVKGKKSYGYLPKPQKKLVDRIVDEMERLPSVRDCYDQWMVLQGKVDGYKERKRVPLSQQKEFRQIKNEVIKEAENIRQCNLSFEDKGVEQESEPEEFRNASYDYETLRDVIRDESLTLEERSDAVSELETLAKSGDKYAQYLMGKLWRDGPLLTPDWVNARYWFQKSAEQGHTYAQYALGKLLLSNDPEVHDVEDGILWLKQAAESGNHFAAYQLGKEYYRGKNIGRNLTTAAKWFERGAQAGNQYTQYMLGKLYLMGQGMEYDKELGAYWLNQASEQGNVYAEALLQHQDSGRPPHGFLSVTRLLHHMSRIFQERSLPQSGTGLQVDSKLRQKIREKKIAMGHKSDDHEDPELTQGGMGGMIGY